MFITHYKIFCFYDGVCAWLNKLFLIDVVAVVVSLYAQRKRDLLAMYKKDNGDIHGVYSVTQIVHPVQWFCIRRPHTERDACDIWHPVRQNDGETRSQAVSRIADRTASPHLWGHVMSSVTWPFDSPYAISYWWSFGTKPLSLKVSEIFNVECSAMVDMTLIRPLNKGQGHSFWYQSISYILLPIGSQ